MSNGEMLNAEAGPRGPGTSGIGINNRQCPALTRVNTRH
jgi:hypothetical protein